MYVPVSICGLRHMCVVAVWVTLHIMLSVCPNMEWVSFSYRCVIRPGRIPLFGNVDEFNNVKFNIAGIVKINNVGKFNLG